MNSDEELYHYFDGGNQYYLFKIRSFMKEHHLRNTEWLKNIKMEYETLSENAIYEFDYTHPLLKLEIYLYKNEDKYFISKKSSATHVLEQIFDKNNVLIYENMKNFI